jgi:hypothetical protein
MIVAMGTSLRPRFRGRVSPSVHRGLYACSPQGLALVGLAILAAVPARGAPPSRTLPLTATDRCAASIAGVSDLIELRSDEQFFGNWEIANAALPLDAQLGGQAP